MKLQAGALLEQIRRAWETVPVPRDDEIAGKPIDCPSEYAYVTDYFGGKHWTEITPEGLLRDYPGPDNACLSFMSAGAFRFFLAAYMRMAVERPGAVENSTIFDLTPPRENPQLYRLAEQAHRDAGLDGMPNPFDPERIRARREWWYDRVAGFEDDQRQAIVAFLEYVKRERDEEDFATDETLDEALKYWKEFARRGISRDGE